MSENQETSPTSVPELSGEPAERAVAQPRQKTRVDGIIVWALVSIGFLGYLTLGSISTRSWQLNSFQQAWVLDISPRRILHIWTYQLDHLPNVAHQWALKAVFGGALGIMVVGAVICVWLMLDEVGTGMGSRTEHTDTRAGDSA
ncbi:MAG TPA: hypothetical protein VFQ54_05190 [Thermomicrobiales bacterium]|nr:hypothetical protein [Thermomicrobiales bacterium]